MGAPINTFNDFMTTTGPAILTGPDQVINEVSKQGGYCMSRFTMGKDAATLVQGGDRIRDVVMLDLESTYDHYQPNDTFSFRNPQSADYIEAFWRFSVDHMTWTDHEIELNIGGGSTVDAQVHTFKKLRKIKEMRLWTSMLNGMEDDLWRTPYGANGFAAQQEPQGGKMQYSVPSFITEHVTTTSLGERGGYPVSNTSGTVMRLNPATEPRWTNQVSFYASNALHGGTQTSDTFFNGTTTAKAAGDYTTHNANSVVRNVNSLFGAMDDMWLKLKYEPPSSRTEYFEKPNLARQLILASREGVNMYRRGLRQANDTLVSYQDPSYGNPQYSGIDVMYCSNLDTAAIFPAKASNVAVTYAAPGAIGNRNGITAGAGDSENGASTIDKGPRFWFVNGSYLTPVFHSNRYFKQHEVLRHPNQPFTYVQMYDCWWNLFCNSRQRHGIVCPILT